MNDTDQEPAYSVVVNDEEQYSYWPVSREVPPGWRRLGPPGNKDDVLRRIESLWTDMRPLSLRRHLARESADHA
ncbi:MbtH family protein [Streptomyces canus]|uniref:MbtH family protein n=1 Tax=Streptomyces canus TaxID=58343 RepID=UPI0036B82786